MLNQERQDEILKRLSACGRVIATELAKEFGVSENAIRRDLRQMAEQGLCRRVYGGALLPAPDAGNIQARAEKFVENKQKISRSISKHIKNGQTIFIDASSTNIAIASGLPRDLPLTVVTNAPAVAIALSEHTLCKTVVLGGIFNAIKGACLGSQTVDQARQVFPDVLILGACGVDLTLGITALEPEEAELKRCLMRQSSKVIVPVILNKMGTAAPFRLSDITEIDVLIVPEGLSNKTLDQFVQTGICVEIAN
ncbi:DeoR/GlpR family DNA-binding transcription regulator [Erwinia tracheiphila]|uniref:DeoR/GlpR transcriptional regulator n=1 Tax=Erwinia tracheiphila TaxID=65700 RepID=A0A345CWE8_9GAMM|nr:DeoR/GlpR family DNA-binding transcription regulator [Erwinia tracheiphila]AXF77765.1 DeoR/GlpR transcriptional regulator [Erwinia tracheiphila]UIA83543.1 DeoR/GlpR family DNA-binding transcription regulator [Erwinia tracheiphila]UIA92128.1 DeoR/GlpR family DNA-binding transcription regulator [Erwinia tracheiphila]